MPLFTNSIFVQITRPFSLHLVQSLLFAFDTFLSFDRNYFELFFIFNDNFSYTSSVHVFLLHVWFFFFSRLFVSLTTFTQANVFVLNRRIHIFYAYHRCCHSIYLLYICNSIIYLITADLLLVNFHYRGDKTGFSILILSRTRGATSAESLIITYSRDALRMNGLLWLMIVAYHPRSRLHALFRALRKLSKEYISERCIIDARAGSIKVFREQLLAVTFDALYYIATDKREYRYFTEYRCIPRAHKLHSATTPFFAFDVSPADVAFNQRKSNQMEIWMGIINQNWFPHVYTHIHTYTNTHHTSNVTSHARFVSCANEDVNEEHFPFVFITSHSLRLSFRKTAGSSSRSRRVFPRRERARRSVPHIFAAIGASTVFRSRRL